MDTTTLVDRYIASWNETDADRRRALIAAVWSDTCRYVDPVADVSGHDSIDAMLSGFQARFPGLVFARTGAIEHHHDRLRFTWDLRTPDGNHGAGAPWRRDGRSHRMIALAPRTLSVRPLFLADAAITGATALLKLAGAPFLADRLELPTGLLAATGAALAPYVAALAWLARWEAPPRRAVQAVIAANLAWAVGCGGLLLSDAIAPNALGTALILVQVMAVLAFAALQALALRGVRR